MGDVRKERLILRNVRWLTLTTDDPSDRVTSKARNKNQIVMVRRLWHRMIVARWRFFSPWVSNFESVISFSIWPSDDRLRRQTADRYAS